MSSNKCSRIGGCLKENLNDPNASCLCDEINDGGYAFPEALGMSLRDYFAGQALIAIATHKTSDTLGWEHAAFCAYLAADAMLEQRSKNE